MKFSTQHWLKITLINLLLVTFLGSLMRYKIGFSFPYFSQKHILYSHSHFAFLGWITQSIYVLLVHFVQSKLETIRLKRYNSLLILHLICSYILLISFFIEGYGFISISFSVLIIVLSCLFALQFFKDLNAIRSDTPSVLWFKAALWFNIISSLGTFYIAYMMASHHFNEKLYLAAMYFYLHFQYNGFFFFSIMGLSLHKIPSLLPTFVYSKRLFQMFLVSVIPAYLLSTLWAQLPIWLYVIVVIAAVVQSYAWICFVQSVYRSMNSMSSMKAFIKYLILFVACAISIKFALQLGSTIPELSKLAFGFRPIVIAYLHLVLLAVVSVFLVSYAYIFELIKVHRGTQKALFVFTAAVLLNELLLGIQGVASFSYFRVPYNNESLFVVSLFLLLGSILLVYSQSTHKKTELGS